jgi:hypothetical protein
MSGLTGQDTANDHLAHGSYEIGSVRIAVAMRLGTSHSQGSSSGPSEGPLPINTVVRRAANWKARCQEKCLDYFPNRKSHVKLQQNESNHIH